MGRSAPLAMAVLMLAALASFAGCRLVAGISDIELETDSGLKSDASDAGGDHVAPADSGGHDAGPCGCDACTVIANDPNLPLSLAIVDNDVYWLDYGAGPSGGALVKAPTAGGSVSTVVNGLTHPIALQTDTKNFYWIATDSSGRGLIEKRPIAGGSIVTLASGQPLESGLLSDGVSQNPSAQFLAVSTTDVYWITFNGSTPIEIWTVPIAGGTPQAFISNLPPSVASATLEPWAIAILGSKMYIINDDCTYIGIFEAALDGSSFKSLVENLTTPYALAVTSKEIVYADDEVNYTNGLIGLAALDGSQLLTLGKGLAGPWSVIVDSTDAYWANSGNAMDFGSIMKSSLDGKSGQIAIAPNAESPQALAQDAKNLYWVDSQCGGVVKAPK